MSVLGEILEWSESTPPVWVRDALRRIVTQREVGDTDLGELVHLCKKVHGLSEGTPDPDPFSGAHLREVGATGVVSLAALTHISDVNALEPGQVLGFAATGLTVVYGDNGAGKSGYARILKRACRARGSADPVLPNALSDRPAGTPTARITAVVAGTEKEFSWRDGTPSSAELGAVSVFDSAAAQVYVSERTEVRFRPFGLDVLDRLAATCVSVKDRLQNEISVLQGQGPRWPPLPPDTAAARFLPTITALTTPAAVDRVAVLSDDEERERLRLEEVLAAVRAEDPSKRAKELQLRHGRLTRLIAAIQGIADGLNARAVEELGRSREDIARAEQGAREMVEAFKAQVQLPGFGSGAWRQLWDAAGNYSTKDAYPAHDFPHVEGDARCVLCQQVLDAAAKERLSGFAAFVRDEAQQEVRRAGQQHDQKRRHIEALNPATLDPNTRQEVGALDPAVARELESFLVAAQECRDALLRGGTDPLAVGAPMTGLTRLAEDLASRAVELERAADPTARQAAERRHADLQAKKMLSNIRAVIDAEIGRLARINAYGRCLGDTDTRQVTILSTELTKKYVTAVLTTAFSDELTALGFREPELELRPVGGARGNLYHQVQLKHATRAELPTVVSEGEARCIALAAFLAELKSAGDASGIVFDDPVSSLDNRWRKNVAARLVEEAKARQVIVFTHDLVFLFALMQATGAKGVSCQALAVRRGMDGAGHVDSDLPWAALTTQKRLGWIKNEWQAVEKVFRTEGQQAYEPRATQLYARLRQTWERAVEEILICGVVERFRPSIETQRLSKLRDVRDTDIAAIQAGMTKCSTWEGGHDHAGAAVEPVPPPDELKRDYTALEDWMKSIEARRK